MTFSVHAVIIIMNMMELSFRTVFACTMSAAQQRNQLCVKKRGGAVGWKRVFCQKRPSNRLHKKLQRWTRLNKMPPSLPNAQDFPALLQIPPSPPAALPNYCRHLQTSLQKPPFLASLHLISCFSHPHLQSLWNPQYPLTVWLDHISKRKLVNLSAQLLLKLLLPHLLPM